MALILTVATAVPAARADAAPRAEASYYSTRGVLAEFFPQSEHVGYRTFALDKSIRARLAQRLGYAPVRDKYTIFVATTHGKIDGYAAVAAGLRGAGGDHGVPRAARRRGPRPALPQAVPGQDLAGSAAPQPGHRCGERRDGV